MPPHGAGVGVAAASILRAMETRIPLAAAAAVLLGCGGAATTTASDAAVDAPVCPTPGSAIADANAYGCEAGAPGTPGCAAQPGDPNAVYPEGCNVVLKTAGTYCGPITCTCQSGSPLADGGLSFICPL
jgi:hypothetical protein